MLTTRCLSACSKYECTDAIGCLEIAPGEPIVLGVIQALSGGPAPIGIMQLRSIELAIAQRDGQLLGHPIATIEQDERCSPEGGTTAALKITADPSVVAVIGTTCSGAATTAAKVVSEAGMVMISGANTAPALTSIGGKPGADWQPGYFRTELNDVERGQAAAIFAYEELGVRRAATLNDGDAFTRGLTEIFGQVFAEQGGEILLSATVNKGDEDMGPMLGAVAYSGAELLFFTLFQPEADRVVLQAARTPGLEDLRLVSAGLFLEDFLQAIGDAGVGTFFAGPFWSEGEQTDALRAAYEARFGAPPDGSSIATGYDACNLLLDAVEAVAVEDAGGTLHVGRQALRDYLYAVTAYDGVSGALSCDQFGDCGVGNFGIYRLDDPKAGVAGLKANVVYTYPN